MGARGPVRDPLSRRGQAEAMDAKRLNSLDGGTSFTPTLSPPVPATDEPEAAPTGRTPTCPAGLPARVATIWKKLVRDLVAAKVPLAEADTPAITQAARCMYASDQAEDMAHDKELTAKERLLALRMEMQAIEQSGKWLERICATPGARARIGIKPIQERPKGTLEQLLEKRQRG